VTDDPATPGDGHFEINIAATAAIDSSFRKPSDLSTLVGGEEFAAILPSTSLSAAERQGKALYDTKRAGKNRLIAKALDPQ
jgi:hypothetical protein